MEGIFFVLIGAALFSQAWHVLGQYSEGRTTGVFSAALGLLALGVFMFGTTITPTLISGDGATALTTALTALIVLWSVYAVAVGAQGLWDLDDRAIGFYSAFLAVVSLVIFLVFAIAMADGGVFEHSLGIWLSMSAVPFLLTIISAIVFFYLAFQIQVLRLVAGWFLLFGSNGHRHHRALGDHLGGHVKGTNRPQLRQTGISGPAGAAAAQPRRPASREDRQPVRGRPWAWAGFHMTNELTIEKIVSQAEREAARYSWEGTLEEYLDMVIEDPSRSRLSHAFIYDAVMSQGSETTPDGDRKYGLFKDDIFGLEVPLDRIVQYFAASSQRFEIRKRILLLLGPPASGKSTITELIKRAMEAHSRTDDGAVYAIKGCPMQEDPLHLVPHHLRKQLYTDHGVYVEGDPCPRCRYMVRTEYKDKFADAPIERVIFSEQEAIGIGYFMANNPNPPDSSLLVGSVNTQRLEGPRQEVAGRAFRLDGEFNVANRGLMELVEMFKADRHLLTTLLSLAQEQIIKMEKFGSVYADEVIIGHSNEGDFNEFAKEEQSEALRDRIISIQIPYNLKVAEEVKIYEKMLRNSSMGNVHIAPLTTQVASAFAVLSRLDPPDRQGVGLLDKLRLYDGRAVEHFTRQQVREMQRHHPDEGMSGISPRYVMNRIGAVASEPGIRCITPLGALNSLWEGLDENISYKADVADRIALIADSIKEYNDLAVRDVRIAYEHAFDAKAKDMLTSYLANVNSFLADLAVEGHRPTRADAERDRDMKEIERVIGVTDRSKEEFRREIAASVEDWQSKGMAFRYDSEPRLKAAIEAKLLVSANELGKSLARPRFGKQRVDWTRRWSDVTDRLVQSYGYCKVCAKDLIQYVNSVLRSRPTMKAPRNEDIEWLWERFPTDDSTYGGGDDE